MSLKKCKSITGVLKVFQWVYLIYDRCLKPLRLHVVTLTADVRFKLRVIKMENELMIKTLQEQFLWIKLVWKYYFLVEVIEKEKENLGHVAQIHVCRQVSLMTSLRTQTAYFRKIRLRSQANIDQHYPKNAFIGETSFNIFMFQKKRKRNNENRASSSFQ